MEKFQQLCHKIFESDLLSDYNMFFFQKTTWSRIRKEEKSFDAKENMNWVMNVFFAWVMSRQ